MKILDLAKVTVRLFALWAILSGVLLLEQVPIAFFNPAYSSEGFQIYLAALNVFNFLLYLSLGLFMLYKTDDVAKFLAKGTNIESDHNTTASELAILGFALIGMVVFIDGLGNVVQQAVVHYVEPEIDMGVQIVKKKFELQIFIVGVAKTLIGITLIFSPAGIVRLLRWTREAGLEESCDPSSSTV